MIAEVATQDAVCPPASQPRDSAGRFSPGVSGNPSGRPKGSGTLARAIRQAYGRDRVLEILEVLRGKALEGDTTAARLYLDRVAGPVAGESPFAPGKTTALPSLDAAR